MTTLTDNDHQEARGTYKGPLPLLKGKKATLVIFPTTGRCLAQFDDTSTGYGYGRHDFETAHFDVEAS